MNENLTVIQLKKSTDQVCTNNKTVINKKLINKTKVVPDIDIKQSESNDAAIYHLKSYLNVSSKKNTSIYTKVKTGSIINKRFVLEDVLGVGGMGKVYKAVDLRKKEAHDKNPYIAIKVLNDEFRDHPESLIALQREARKSQLLSHPNIVNVYDFDRDGDVVYMTMELLQGRPLDELINDIYPDGMPEEIATPIINAIANAVLYAHQHGIIHSDLKPANVFITDDNKAKIFDFGIARAYQMSQEQLENTSKHDQTLFDPTELGALTPSYASLEMLEGKAPEPHDDIYSIACVIYELLTGSHPFKRLPADKAKEQSIKLKKISGLDKSKFNAISTALSFDGNSRFNNIELFIKAYNYKKNNKTPILISMFISLVIILAFSFPLLLEQYNQHEQSQFIDTINSMDYDFNSQGLRKVKNHINSLDKKINLFVLENIKNKWMLLVENKIKNLSKDINNKSDYENVLQLLNMTQVYYSDSAQVSRLFDLFEKNKFIELNRLNTQFNELLEILQYSGLMANSVEHDQIVEIISQVKKIDINHPLVNDQRLRLLYQDTIELFLSDSNLSEAYSLLSNAMIVFPNEIIFKNLADKIKSLNVSEQIKFTSPVLFEQSKNNISQVKTHLSSLILKSDSSKKWHKEITRIYEILNVELGSRSVWLNEKKQILASLYLQMSVSMRDKQHLVEARRLLDKAKEYDDTIFGLNDEETILIALENIVEVKYNAKQLWVKVEGLKNTLMIQLKAQKMNAAIETYEDIKRILGRNNPFVSRDAKKYIISAYYKKARQLFANKRYQHSMTVASKGLKFDAQHLALRSLFKKALKQKRLLRSSLEFSDKASIENDNKNKIVKHIFYIKRTFR